MQPLFYSGFYIRKGCSIPYTTGGRIISGLPRKELDTDGSTTETQNSHSSTGSRGVIGSSITSVMLRGGGAVAQSMSISIEAEWGRVIINIMFISRSRSRSIEESRIRACGRKRRIEIGIIMGKEREFIAGTSKDEYLKILLF